MSSTLDEIRARAAAYAEYGTPGLRAPQDRADLLAILAKVEALLDNMATFPGGAIPAASPGVIIRAEIYGGGL